MKIKNYSVLLCFLLLINIAIYVIGAYGIFQKNTEVVLGLIQILISLCSALIAFRIYKETR